MQIGDVARMLGQRGGRARAARLAPEERRRIAALGGRARRRSFELARRLAENFRYVSAIDALRGGSRTVTSVSRMVGRVPGLYPDVTGS